MTEDRWKRRFLSVTCTDTRLRQACSTKIFRINLGSGKLPTYPSPNSTLTFASHLGQNGGLGEG